ncbi:MAG: amino acid adenylation domain-containing protein [bacterium]|nr:amino acid adenylation domain-containing protein [bacterium]
MSIQASYHQERLFFIDEFEKNDLYEENPVYHNVPLILEITGRMNNNKIENSLNCVIGNHSILTANFFTENGVLFRGNNTKKLELEIQEIGNISKDILVETFINKPFDLENDLLIRAMMLSDNDKKHMLVICLHHIVCDKKSLSLLFDEMIKQYEEEDSKKEYENSDIVFKNFSKWQKELTEEQLEPYIFYWRKKLKGKIKSLDLPIKKVRNAIHIYESKSKNLKIPLKLNKKIERFCCVNNISPYSVYLACFQLTLGNFSQQREVVIGITEENRTSSKLEKVIGPIANIQPIRSILNGDSTFNSYLKSVNDSLIEAKKFKDIPFDRLVLEINPDKDMSRTALFDVLFQFSNGGRISKVLKDCTITNTDVNLGWGKYDLNLLILDDKSNSSGIITYNALYYEDSFVSRFMDHYIDSICKCIDNPDCLLGTINFITKAEEQRQLTINNKSGVHYPGKLTIHQLFEHQVELYPNNIAVHFNGTELTYKELNGKANQVARTLRDRGIENEQIIGILVDRSIDMMISIIAILKAGGAYLPINPEYPEDRIDFMISDSGINMLLTTNKTILDSMLNLDIIMLDDPAIEKKELINIENRNLSTDLAYIIYTSGTTGTPKGTMIQHNNVIRLFRNDEQKFNFDENDVWTLFHSFCFDFSVWEMYGALLHGGKLVIISEETTKNAEDFLQVLIDLKVTILNQTPSSFYNLMFEELKRVMKELILRYVIFGGESLKSTMLKQWRERYPKTKLINMYGITETTVHVTYKELSKIDIEIGLNNIGAVIPTLSAYIFDKNNKLLPTGITGELFVGGEGVARGYLNREQLTRDRFIENPYIPTEKLYKSGDLVKMLESGELVYQGRKDNQVKIRGFRIELGEIEARVLSLDKIREAVVLPINDNDLCVYFVSDKNIETNQIKSYISKDLPEYMIPSFFIKVDKFTITQNGKVDVSDLPDPDINIISDVEYLAPGNKIEKDLVNIWQEVLKIEPIGIKSNFFDIGGHSLKATMLISRIKEELNTAISLRDLFQNPTILDLSKLINTTGCKKHESIDAINKQKLYDLSHAQMRLWILDQLEEVSSVYSIPSALKLNGKLNEKSIKDSYSYMLKRHESLRTVYVVEDGIPKQKILENIDSNIIIEDLRNYEEPYFKAQELVETELEKPFDLEKSGLIRMHIFRYENEEYLLLLNMHHIISDGWSMTIFIKEFLDFYNNIEEGNTPAIIPLQIHYKDYSAWQNNLLNSVEIDKQKEFWLKKLSCELPILDLPSDFVRPAVQTYNGDSLDFSFSKENSTALTDLCRENKISLFMVLQALIKVLVYRYTGQTDIILGSPVAGRIHKDLENQIGFFVNTLAFRDSIDGDIKFTDFLKEIKKTCIDAYDNQDYPFDKLIEDLDIERDLSRSPLFNVMLVLQNNDIPEINFKDLSVQSYEIKNTKSKFDISLNFVEVDEELYCKIVYNTDIYSEDRIKRMAEHLKILFSSVLSNPESQIKDLEIIPVDEKNLLLNVFNDTKIDYPAEKTIIDLFEEQVRKNPDNIAVVFEDLKMTYRELNEKANIVGHYLKDNYDIKPDDLVGVMLDRSEKMIIAILGILKSGAAYVPIDPEYPEERISSIIRDSNPRAIMSEKKNIVNFNTKILLIDEVLQLKKCVVNLEKNIGTNNIAYVIFTSGSTGKPKGVVINHSGVINTILDINSRFKVNENDSCLAISSLCFDLSVYDVFGLLGAGGSIVIPTKDESKDPAAWYRYLINENITLWNSVPAFMEMLVEYCIDKKTNLSKVLLSGDWISLSLPDQIKKLNDGVQVISLGGATEASIWSISYSIEKVEKSWSSIPYGKPLNNQSFYILDNNLKLSPVGVAGNIYIGGDGLAQCYMNRPDLTGNSFVNNPLITGKRIYRTGDLGRWLDDGNIEFLGRIDNQVKIRGFRIELGEIENVLYKSNNIDSTVVVVRENPDGGKEIVAYYVAEKKVEVSELRTFLGKSLPYYMIPSYFINIESLPLTSNGKIDRKALPKVVGKINTGMEYVSPRNETEERLVEIWQEILEIERIGIHDNFFELGGHSLKALQINMRIKQELFIDIDIKGIFEMSTIYELAELIKKKESEELEIVEDNAIFEELFETIST